MAVADSADETIARLLAAGVRLVRMPLAAPYEAAHAFLIKADRAGIRIALIVTLWDMSLYPTGTPLRRSVGLPGMFDMPPLSAADPARFATFFGPHLARIDAAGVQLAALELGNEINWAAFNGDFTLPATGRVLGNDDLSTDPDGQRIAAGLNTYVRLAATLKAMRDKTRRNARTPIISAGLADFGRPDRCRPTGLRLSPSMPPCGICVPMASMPKSTPTGFTSTPIRHAPPRLGAGNGAPSPSRMSPGGERPAMLAHRMGASR